LITNKPLRPFSATLKPSKVLLQFTIVLHLLAVLAALGNDLPLAIQLIIVGFIVIDAWFTIKRVRTEQRVISYSAAKGWQLSDNSKVTDMQVLPSTVLTTLVIFLHTANNPALLIAYDALSQEDYRRLIVLLKITTKYSAA
jgi:Membrane-bound toxin component of toxin-antitoxin system